MDNNYDGLFRFTKIVDATMGDVPIPNDDTAGTHQCTMQIRPSTASSSSTSIMKNDYDIGIKIGNSMGASATIIPATTQVTDDAITIGGLRSTMMMPPPELYRIEMALSDILPSATNIRIENDVLTIKGSKGSVQATRQV